MWEVYILVRILKQCGRLHPTVWAFKETFFIFYFFMSKHVWDYFPVFPQVWRSKGAAGPAVIQYGAGKLHNPDLEGHKNYSKLLTLWIKQLLGKREL